MISTTVSSCGCSGESYLLLISFIMAAGYAKWIWQCAVKLKDFIL